MKGCGCSKDAEKENCRKTLRNKEHLRKGARNKVWKSKAGRSKKHLRENVVHRTPTSKCLLDCILFLPHASLGDQ